MLKWYPPYAFTLADENLGLGVLEEKSSDTEDEEEMSSDGDENIFDKLLRKTQDPIRGVLIRTLADPQQGGRGKNSDDETRSETNTQDDEEEEKEGSVSEGERDNG